MAPVFRNCCHFKLSDSSISKPNTHGMSCISMFNMFSPLFQVILPQMGVFTLRNSQLKCNVECDGFFLSFTFKLLVLLIGSWAVFYRKPRSFLPRMQLMRSVASVLLALFICTFWLFYIVKLKEQRKKIQYPQIVEFSSQFLNSLLALHYLALLVFELRHRGHPVYLIKVIIVCYFCYSTKFSRF